MITYKLINDNYGQPICVNRSDGCSIPFDLANTDYQAYLKWVAEGHQPEPAEETQ